MAFTDNTTGGRVIQQGLMPYRITLTDTCVVGDLIGCNAAGAWARADANAKIYAEFVAGEKCAASGDALTVFRQAIISGFTGGTIGLPIYLSDTVGAYEDIPSSAGYQQPIGVCLSTTEALINPNAGVGVFTANRNNLGWGGAIRSEIQSGQTASNVWGGLKVEVKSLATSVLSSDVYGIFLNYQLASIPSGSSACLRMDDNCDASCHPESWIVIAPGNVGPTYFFDLGSITTPSGGASVATGTNKTGNGGWLTVKTNLGTRYINLYTT